MRQTRKDLAIVLRLTNNRDGEYTKAFRADNHSAYSKDIGLLALSSLGEHGSKLAKLPKFPKLFILFFLGWRFVPCRISRLRWSEGLGNEFA